MIHGLWLYTSCGKLSDSEPARPLPSFLPSSMMEETLANTGIVQQLQWLAEANRSYRDSIRVEVCW